MSRVTFALLLGLFLPGLIIFSVSFPPHIAAYADGGDSDKEKDHDRKKSEDYWSKVWDRQSKNSHERTIRNAVQQKKILPLGKIKQIVKNKTNSEIISTELERKKRRWVYEFKIVDRQGRLREIYVDATNGTIIKSKYKD